MEKINWNLEFQVTNGGRSLDAIWDNENLDIYQSSILHYLGSQMDFVSDSPKDQWVPITILYKKCKMEQTKVLRTLKSLEKKEYVKYCNVNNACTITNKIFREYKMFLMNNPNVVTKFFAEYNGIISSADTSINTKKPKKVNPILLRDNYTCQKCFCNNKQLYVHHIIPRKDGGKNNRDNLITLCKDCHNKTHTELRFET